MTHAEPPSDGHKRTYDDDRRTSLLIERLSDAALATVNDIYYRRPEAVPVFRTLWTLMKEQFAILPPEMRRSTQEGVISGMMYHGRSMVDAIRELIKCGDRAVYLEDFSDLEIESYSPRFKARLWDHELARIAGGDAAIEKLQTRLLSGYVGQTEWRSIAHSRTGAVEPAVADVIAIDRAPSRR